MKTTFIFGAPRSGTTWLWSMVSAHPMVAPYNIKGRSESGAYLKKNASENIRNFAMLHKRMTILEKTPAHVFHERQIRADFPNSRNIVLFRHPIGIVNSMVRSNMKAFQHYTVSMSIAEVKKYYAILPSIKGFRITYSQLNKNTSHKLSEIFSYLDLYEIDTLELEKKFRKKPTVQVSGVFRKGEVCSFENEMDVAERRKCENELKEEIEVYHRITESL